MIFIIIFWTSIALIFHSYVLYPLLLQILASKKKDNSDCYSKNDELPMVSIIMSVHNEEMVFNEKIRSIYYTLYPKDSFEVIVGSDASNDRTNKMGKVFTENYPNFNFFAYKTRRGKPAVLNDLVKSARSEILILTDAKVFFGIDTIFNLVKHFKNPGIDIVGGNLKTKKDTPVGIATQEKAFLSREINMKIAEGKIWGKTMGVYGAIYAIRKNSFTPVPENYSVDDFFITLAALVKGSKAIISGDAEAFEEVPDKMGTEYKRKLRISTGNFQNLFHFCPIFLKPWKSLFFVFFSHKAIRWIGPVLLVIIYLSNLMLVNHSGFYYLLFILYNILLISPLIDFLLGKLNIHIVFLRFISHFLAMNVALMGGLLKFLLGKKTNIWEPTKR